MPVLSLLLYLSQIVYIDLPINHKTMHNDVELVEDPVM